MRKKLVLLLLSMVTSIAFCLVAILSSKNNSTYADNFRSNLSQIGDYSLKIDYTTPFSDSGEGISEVTVYTLNNNPIAFEGNHVEHVAGQLCRLRKDTTGTYQNFIQNRTPISGVIGFTVNYIEEDKEDELFVEWVRDDTRAVDSATAQHNKYVDISNSQVKNPTHIKFNPSYDNNLEGNNIKSIEFFYKCTPTERSELPDYLKAEIVDGKAYISEYKYLNAGTRIIHVPDTYLGYPVVGFKNASVFNHDSSVGYVVLPDSITELPSDAFRGCDRLYGIELPAHLTSIPEYAFYNCRQLKQIVLPSTVETIGSNAFNNCTRLESCSMGSSLRTIDAYAFAYTALSDQIIMPETLQRIYDYAFFGTQVTSFVVSSNVIIGSNNPTIVLHTDVKTGVNMLDGIYGVTDSTIRTYTTDIANQSYSFTYVKYDVGDGESIAIVKATNSNNRAISLPLDIDGLPITYIGPSAFSGIQAITVNLPMDVFALANYAFRYSTISSFRTYDGLKMIGTECFAAYSNTSRIDSFFYLNGESITYVGNYAFKYIPTIFYFNGEDPTENWGTAWKYYMNNKGIVTNYPNPYQGSYPVVKFDLGGVVNLDVYHNETLSYCSRNRYADYMKNLTTGLPEATTGGVIFKLSCENMVFETSNVVCSGTVTKIANNTFKVIGASNITITTPYYVVKLIADGFTDPYFFSDPATQLNPITDGKLTRQVMDDQGNPVYDDSGMIAFKINPAANKRPNFTADCIKGTYTNYYLIHDIVLIMGISSNIVVKLDTADDFYRVDFTYDEGISKIITYPMQDYSEGKGTVANFAYTTNPLTGELASTYSYSKPQVNFEFVLKEGYQLASIAITPNTGYKNLKFISDTIRRVTVITCDLTIEITTSPISA